jgi:hypothetical protein
VTSSPAEAPQVLPENARAFLAADPPRHVTIATVDRDGTPHQIVAWYRLVHGDDGGGDRLIVNSRRGRRWPSNLERERRASLAVYEGDDAVTIECELEQVYDGEQAVADISEMARRYYAPDAAERDIAVFSAQQRVTFVLRPIRVHVHGDPH